MKDLMIDLETLGAGSDAVVLSIGAVFFDVETGEYGESYYSPLSVQDQLNKGRRVEERTLRWWMNQSEDARKVFKEEVKITEFVLSEFVFWIYKQRLTNELYVWGNGSMFDISIMESLFRSFNYEAPWKYNNVMDLRTFKRFNSNGEKIVRIGTHHNALDDAITQAQFVINALGRNR